MTRLFGEKFANIIKKCAEERQKMKEKKVIGNMKNNITELVFILDRSGSMAGLESDTMCATKKLIENEPTSKQ